ncbi:RraA family protein [Micrococcus sp. GPGPB33]|uniref:RraA family protein n=1 Tax=Micrococcus TaxID=1269 RepID=UPI0011A51A44|nr:RraA family protein [Micrococcus luteus]MCT1940958.1 RraA family protein [Micrococcus luteus]MCV7606088.1 RraA family protein [Micrococcus luteus]MCV7672555.1 RraA family protein [Micrococcus luteus]MCV7691635.1 RraA family protein [Micrococcus luteus]MCV7708255.1 RraA family protein [Micrococcus luteus]
MEAAPHIDRLKALPSAAVSDALDALGLPGSIQGLSRRATDSVVAGRAFTVRYEEAGDEAGTVGDFLDDVPAGDVVVIDNSGRTDCTTWGGIMSRVAAMRAVAGTVVHGACRDVSTSSEAGYPIWSSGVFMRTGKDRVRCAEVQGELLIDGVGVHPGDFVLADADGVVVVPQSVIGEVLDLAEHIETTEDKIVADVQAGSRLVESRERFQYHTLQRAVAP